MGKRRLPGEGSIFRLETQRPDGSIRVRYRASVSYGGRDSRSFRTKTCRTYAEARAALRELLDDQREMRDPSKLSLGVYLRSWLADTVQVAANTRRGYEDALAHLDPIAHVRLDLLDADAIERCVNAMVTRRRYGGGEPASAKTKRNVISMLRTALAVAEERGKVRTNVAMQVKLPKVPRRKPDFDMTPEMARSVLAAIAGDPLEAAYALAMVGLREGEILGLATPADVNLGESPWVWPRYQNEGQGPKARRVELKTRGSEEPVPIPRFVAERLRAHLASASRPIAPIDGALVFVNRHGYCVNASWFSHHLERLTERAGLPVMTPHDLRHGASTLLAEAGVHPRVAQELLRHSTSRTTMEVYTHVSRKQEREAADVLDRIVGDRSYT